MNSSIKIGVSACLVGQRVRYDGGHKHDHYITDTLGRFFTFVPVCPEVESGMTTPREAMRLEGDAAQPRLMTRQSRMDKTEQMVTFCNRKVRELEQEELCGFVFKKDSPSSGLFRVKVYGAAGTPAQKNGSGLFAAAFSRHFPLLPMEEEGRLTDAALRENFIERVFSYRRWKDFLADAPGLGKLVEFHSCNKLLMMAHSQKAYREMGVLVAHGKEFRQEELFRRYEELMMNGLALHATAKKQTNVLMHILGYFKQDLSAAEKAELLELIQQYHNQQLPLLAPLILIKHYVNKYDKDYLKQQWYLSPYPAELMLRNHV